MKKLTKKQKQKIKEIAIAVISAALTALTTTLTSCGVTKATITKPASGTYTTVTITTNNPIETNVSPNVNLKGKE